MKIFPPDIIDPNAIGDHHLEIDQQLHDYQAKLDEARERVNSGELTQSEFKELRQTLYADIPDHVREHVSDDYKPEVVSLNEAFNTPAAIPSAVSQVPNSAAQYNVKEMPNFQ